MTIEQTVEIPADRRVVIKVPETFTSGKVSVILFDEPFQTAGEEGKPALTPAEALEEMFGCSANTGDTLDAFMERHWADNDLERAIELRRDQERRIRHEGKT
jgi:hypothetical protein